MKCDKCAYEGDAEVGDFGIDRELLLRWNFRCPRCGSADVHSLHPIDGIRRALRFPRGCRGGGCVPAHSPAKKRVFLIFGGADPRIVGYSISCPVCTWGMGSAISLEDAERIVREFSGSPWLSVNKLEEMNSHGRTGK